MVAEDNEDLPEDDSGELDDEHDPAAAEHDDDDPATDWDLEDDEGEEAAASRARLVLVGLALLIVGLLVGRLTAPDNGADGGDRAAVADPADEAIPFPAGDVSRTGYWGFVGLRPVVVDTFDRPDNASTLGDSGTGQPWQVDAGEWGIEDNSAFRVAGAPGAQSIAVVPVGDGDGLVEVTATVVEQGAGMVFRYLDPSNYWTITANPALGSWAVHRVIDGQQELVGELAAPTADGVTVTITQNEALLRFLVDGIEYLRLTDATFEGQLQAGIVSSAESNGAARWDRFLTMRTAPVDADQGEDPTDPSASVPTTEGG